MCVCMCTAMGLLLRPQGFRVADFLEAIQRLVDQERQQEQQQQLASGGEQQQQQQENEGSKH